MELENEMQIYLQDVVCTKVMESLDKPLEVLYNEIAAIIPLDNFEIAQKAVDLIEMNRRMLQNIENEN